MSRFFKKFIAILLLLSILSSNVTAMALEDDFGNSYSQAGTIPMDASISGVINYSGDVDYFKFIAPATGTYYVTSTGTMDLYGVTYNSTYSKIISNDDIGEGNNNFEMSATLTAGKTYFVKVRHYNKSQTGSYMVRITAPNSKDITAVILPYQTAPLYANTESERCKVQLFNKNIGVERKYYVEAYTSSDNKTWTLSGASDFVFVAGSNTATLSIPVNISNYGNIYTKAVVYFEKKGGDKLKEVIKADIDRVAPQMLPTNNLYKYGESAGILIDNLNALGLDTGNGTLFASKTLAAVVAVQINNNNLAIDGKAGKDTCKEINSLISTYYFDSNGQKLSSIKTILSGIQKVILNSQNNTIKEGSDVKSVKHLQAILKEYLNLNIGDVDGDYGKKTTAAVKAVQKYCGLAVTGTVEKGTTQNTTWDKIYSLINSNESTKIALDQLYKEYLNPAQSVYISAKNKLTIGDYDTIYARSTNATSMKLLITGPEYYRSITSEGSTISYKFEPAQSGTYYITVTANEGGALPQTEKVCVEVGKKETGNVTYPTYTQNSEVYGQYSKKIHYSANITNDIHFLEKIIKDSKTYQDAIKEYGLENVERENPWHFLEIYYGSMGWLAILDDALTTTADEYNEGKITFNEMITASNIYRDLIKLSYVGKFAATHTESQDIDDDLYLNADIRTAISDEAYKEGITSGFSMKPSIVGYQKTLDIYRQRENFITFAVIGLISDGIWILNSRVMKYALQENAGVASILASKTATVEVKAVANAIEKDVSIASKLTQAGESLENIVWRGTRIVNGQTIVDDIGAFGEHIAESMLQQNGWKNFKYIKNGSDNGIDIVAQATDGHWGFFEVKTSSTGSIPNLSPRQANMDAFVNDILYNAKEGLGRYQNIDSATKQTAEFLYNEYKSNPYNFSGNVIGVDIESGIIRVSSWDR